MLAGRRRRLLHRRAGDGEHRHLPARARLPARRSGRSPRRHGTLLIFDEVKTGITAGWGGATGALGVQPDLVSLAKSIGGGFPIGAFGGTAGVHGLDHRGQGAAPRHLQRQPARDGGDQGRAGRGLHARGDAGRRSTATAGYLDACDAIIAERRPARPHRPVRRQGLHHLVADPVRNYRDYKATDFDLAFAQWLYGINRGVLLPPGLDEQWLISVHARRRRRRARTSRCSRSSSPTPSPPDRPSADRTARRRTDRLRTLGVRAAASSPAPARQPRPAPTSDARSTAMSTRLLVASDVGDDRQPRLVATSAGTARTGTR